MQIYACFGQPWEMCANGIGWTKLQKTPKGSNVRGSSWKSPPFDMNVFPYKVTGLEDPAMSQRSPYISWQHTTNHQNVSHVCRRWLTSCRGLGGRKCGTHPWHVFLSRPMGRKPGEQNGDVSDLFEEAPCLTLSPQWTGQAHTWPCREHGLFCG